MAGSLIKMQDQSFNEIGPLLLEIGTLLMSSGATAERVSITINRIAESFGYSSEVLITYKSLIITISDVNRQPVYTHLKRASDIVVNFQMISGISLMSWCVVEEKWTLSQINEELKRLKKISAYPRWLVLTLVALAGASFCRLLHGEVLAMAVSFAATFFGLWIKQESARREINTYFCTYFSALAATLVSGFFFKFQINPNIEHAVAASVLFLIPGISLINSFSDFIDGNLQSGLLKGLNGLVIIFSITLGMLTALLVYGVRLEI